MINIFRKNFRLIEKYHDTLIDWPETNEGEFVTYRGALKRQRVLEGLAIQCGVTSDYRIEKIKED